MNRREFLTASAALSLVPIINACSQGESADQESVMRTITYNVLACRGFPETEENRVRVRAAREHLPERMAQELARYQPDIVTFQEGPAEDVVKRIADVLGMRYVFFPGGWGGDTRYPGGFPGVIFTHYDIVSSINCPMPGGGGRPPDLFTRHWGMAVLDAPMGHLPVFSGHLHPSDAAVRAREVTEALAVIQPVLAREGRVLLQGDLNHRPNGPEYPRWREAGLVDIFATHGSGPQTNTMSSIRPRNRIDYIWAGEELAEKTTSCQILWEGGFRTDPDDDSSFALSDHIPVLAEFRT